MTSTQPPEAHPSKRSLRGWFIVSLCALTLGLAFIEVGAILVQHAQAPANKDWKQAVKQLSAGRLPREPVLFAPDWVAPVARHHLGDQLSVRLSTLSDVDRFDRVWQLSIRDAQHRWLAGKKPSRTSQHGTVTLALFEQQAVTVLYDFYQQLKTANVRLVGDQTEFCRKDGDRFRCSDRRWQWVGQHLAEVNHKPYRCIYAHPTDKHVLRIFFDRVPIGNSLVIYTGIDDFESRKRAEAHVNLRVMINGEKLGAVAHQNHWAWHRTEIDTRAISGKRRTVHFEVDSPQAFARTFCFHAETRK